ncbi:hypothetical protein CSW59_09380 [Caulobacter sp. BP25]|nr:hypothetical protein CSW59_09380 [Caulobacter sp. BP25]
MVSGSIHLATFTRPSMVQSRCVVILGKHRLQLMRLIVLKSFLEFLILGFATVAVCGLVATPHDEKSHEPL